MSSALLTAPPQTLSQWLLRSMSWTAICVLPCAGFGYLFMLVGDADWNARGTESLLTLLTMGIVLGSGIFFTQAFSGFNLLFQRAQWHDWSKGLALSWFSMLVLAFISWLLLDAFLVLITLFIWFDDGKPWSF